MVVGLMKTAASAPFRHVVRLLLSFRSSVMPSALTHWLGVRAIPLASEQIAIREGLRAGVAVGAVMVVAMWLHAPLMAWSAFAAFWTCLVDPGGLLAARLRAMLTFGAAGTVITGLVAMLAGWGLWPSLVGLGAISFLCGLARVRGAVATQISVLAAIVGVVAVCYPQTPMGALDLSGLFVLGTVWATVVCVLAWPVDPYAPQRQACAAIFREQARMLERLLHIGSEEIGTPTAISAWRRDIRLRIEQTRGRVEALGIGPAPTTSRTWATLLPAVEASDRIFVAAMAFEHAAFTCAPSPVAARTIRLMVATLQRVARELQRVEPRAESLDQSIRFLRTAGERDTDLFTRGAHLCADALTDLQTAWRKADVSPVRGSSVGAPSVVTSWTHPVFLRHAARLSLGVMVAYLLALWLALPYAYWAMMAVVVVTQPSRDTTLLRTIERVAGSIAGGVLAALMGVLLPIWAILALVFPLAALTIALRSVNYTLCVMFMTQLFVLVTDLVSPAHGWDVGLARALNNIMGSFVGLGACLLLWPARSAAPLAVQVMEACRANLHYAVLASDVRKVGWPEIERARREAGVFSTRAEILCQQGRMEGLRRSEQLVLCADVLFQIRQLAGAATIWWMEHTEPPTEAARTRAINCAVLEKDVAESEQNENLSMERLRALHGQLESLMLGAQ
ncbi:hypothetical protein AA0472_3105 [Acetobacter estunensis NRIC 0472]|nr:hypothetical protein AA0472_3105 [Acetobacter estunensis NRIC 0472]